MKIFHNISYSMFIKADEDAKEEQKLFLQLFPFSLEEEKIPMKLTKAEGFEGRIIRIIEVRVEKERQIKACIEQLKNMLSTQDIEQLARQENRVDENCHFFLRLDKEEFHKGVWKLTDTGNCIHIKASVAAFPKKQAVAQKKVKEIFK